MSMTKQERKNTLIKIQTYLRSGIVTGKNEQILEAYRWLEDLLSDHGVYCLDTPLPQASPPTDEVTGFGYQSEIMDRTHIIRELIDNALLNNAGITDEQKLMVESVLDTLGELYQDAGKKSFESDEVRLSKAEYDALVSDRERLDWFQKEKPTVCHYITRNGLFFGVDFSDDKSDKVTRDKSIRQAIDQARSKS